ncbi:hypothetical protein [Bacillus paranthracis]|uniref:hypothetical protein n=1 Tax=Bacillus paranthracis TaxID=2026186 RepID=UPI001E554389|nr:hypothetical protein [Bacillus paranthracis]MCC2536569.1 hypothetical protein [Bacillus paranthracis]
MKIKKIIIKPKKKFWPEHVVKLREMIAEEKAVRSRLKKGDLYDMKELEKVIFDEEYYMREIQRLRDEQYLEKQKYWVTEEGQARIMEMKYDNENAQRTSEGTHGFGGKF